MTYPEPVLEPVGGTEENYMVVAVFVHPTSVGMVTVRVGFVSDGASLPVNLGWSHWDAVTAAAAVLHDGLYESELAPRSDADRVLRETMLQHGCSSFRAWVYWCAVRSFGWIPWKQHTLESITKARQLVSVSNQLTGAVRIDRMLAGGILRTA